MEQYLIERTEDELRRIEKRTEPVNIKEPGGLLTWVLPCRGALWQTVQWLAIIEPFSVFFKTCSMQTVL